LPAWQLHDDEVDNSLFVRTRVRDHDDAVCSLSKTVQAILLARSGMHVRVMKVGSYEAPGRRLVVGGIGHGPETCDKVVTHICDLAVGETIIGRSPAVANIFIPALLARR